MKILILISLLVSLVFASIGQVTGLRGKANLHRGDVVTNLDIGTKLEKKDIIKTFDKTKVQIIFNDNTIITVGKKSTLDIQDYLYDENNAKNSKVNLKFSRGAFKSITGKIGKLAPARFKLKTKNATIGIRGTTLAGNQNRVICERGRIVVSPVIPEGMPIPPDFAPVEVPAGMMVMTPEGVAFSAPVPFIAGEMSLEDEAEAEEEKQKEEEKQQEEEKKSEEKQEEKSDEQQEEQSDEKQVEEEQEEVKEEIKEEVKEETPVQEEAPQAEEVPVQEETPPLVLDTGDEPLVLEETPIAVPDSKPETVTTQNGGNAPIIVPEVPKVIEDDAPTVNPIPTPNNPELNELGETAEEEATRIAAEKAQAELDRIAAEKAQAELDRIAAEKAQAELDRIAAEEAQAELDRIAAEEAQAELDRIAAEEAQAELDRIAAEEAQAELDRIAAEEAQAELDRIAAEEAQAELDRIVAEEQAELDRIAAEEQAELDRIAAEEQAELDRIAAEEAQAELDRIAAEEAAAAQAAADTEAAKVALGVAIIANSNDPVLGNVTPTESTYSSSTLNLSYLEFGTWADGGDSGTYVLGDIAPSEVIQAALNTPIANQTYVGGIEAVSTVNGTAEVATGTVDLTVNFSAQTFSAGISASASNGSWSTTTSSTGIDGSVTKFGLDSTSIAGTGPGAQTLSTVSEFSGKFYGDQGIGGKINLIENTTSSTLIGVYGAKTTSTGLTP